MFAEAMSSVFPLLLMAAGAKIAAATSSGKGRTIPATTFGSSNHAASWHADRLQQPRGMPPSAELAQRRERVVRYGRAAARVVHGASAVRRCGGRARGLRAGAGPPGASELLVGASPSSSSSTARSASAAYLAVRGAVVRVARRALLSSGRTAPAYLSPLCGARSRRPR